MIFWLKSLRMKQQALVIQGTIILLALILMSILLIPLSSKGLNIIKQSSHEALIKSNDAKVQLLSNKIKTLIDQAFLRADLTLNKAQSLYLKNINSQCKMTSSWKKKPVDGYFLTYQQPYNAEKINSTSDYFQKFGNLISQIDSFLLSFNLEQSSNIQMLCRIQRPHISSVFSPITQLSNIDIEARPYYTEHISQNNTRLIGSPFISASTQKVSFMITQTLYDRSYTKELIMIIGFQFDNLSKYLSLNNIKFVLCSLSGIIVSSNINNTLQVQTFKELTYIYNQTIFPFNQDDWDQMKKYLQNETYESNCQSSFIKFCRNMNGNDIQLEASFVQSKFIQIMYQFQNNRFNDLSFTKLEDQILQNNIEELLIAIMNNSIAFCTWCLFILILSTVMMARIIKPLPEMIKVLELIIQNSSLDKKEDTEQFYPEFTNIFNDLQKSFLSFIQRHVTIRQKKINILNVQRFPQLNHFAVFNTQGIQKVQNKGRNSRQRNSIKFRELYSIKNENASTKLLQHILNIIYDY